MVFNTLRHQVLSIQKVLENTYRIKKDLTKVSFLFKGRPLRPRRIQYVLAWHAVEVVCGAENRLCQRSS